MQPLQQLPLQQIEPLQPLKQLKPILKSDTRACLKYPSDLDLISLSVDICYQANLILHNQAKCKKDLAIESYIKKAIELQKILKDYENNYIDMREYNKIKKEFGLNNLD